MSDLWESLTPETRHALAEVVRVCARCGGDVTRLADVDGTDHYVIAESPLVLSSTELNATGSAYEVTATRHAEITLCSTLHPPEL